MKLIENFDEFVDRFSLWRGGDDLKNYPFVENVYTPFSPLQRSLPMLNLALISSAGAYIDGTEPFDTENRDGDLNYREIPVEVGAEDLKYSARGYDPSAVQKDMNSQIPIERLLEYEGSAVIGNLNQVWWSLSSYMPNAAKVAEKIAPKIAVRVKRHQAQAALLVPASRLCHQTLSIIARELEQMEISTMLISVDRSVTDKTRPPRTAYYRGKFGSVTGKPGWKQYQHRILDESIRWIETFDQPTTRKLVVNLETETEMTRGEK